MMGWAWRLVERGKGWNRALGVADLSEDYSLRSQYAVAATMAQRLGRMAAHRGRLDQSAVVKGLSRAVARSEG